MIESDINIILSTIRLTKKQKQLFRSHFLELKETYFLKREKGFNRTYNSINDLGKATKKALLDSFEAERE